MNETFAESVALVGMSVDGARTLSGRLARFPARRKATLWLTVSAGDALYSSAHELPLSGPDGITPLAGERVEFYLPGVELGWYVRRGSAVERFSATALQLCSAQRVLQANDEQSSDTAPVRAGFHAEFVAEHVPVSPRRGRLEVFGRVVATLELPGGPVSFEGPSKWHEQTGDRPSFGTRFTYMSIQNADVSLLARAGDGSCWGFAVLDGRTVSVSTFAIEPPAQRRRFRLTLADGREITGTATIRWLESMPVEGLQRPGAFVEVDSSLGPMLGRLNDWDPDAPTPTQDHAGGRVDAG